MAAGEDPAGAAYAEGGTTAGYGEAAPGVPEQAPGEYIPAQQSADPYAAGPGNHQDGTGSYAAVQGDQDGTGSYAAVPQQNYGEWDAPQYQGADYGQYQGGQDPGQYYQADPYQQDPYQQQGAYDPYGYDAQQQPYATGTGEAAPYDGHDGHDENATPGQGPWPNGNGNASRGESE